MLLRVLFHGIGHWRLGIAWISALLGWTLLGGTMQLWQMAEQAFSRQDPFLAPAHLIIHKPVSLINLPGKNRLGFTETEISELRRQPFVEAVEAFVANRFQVRASFGGSLFAGLETELFFESIPDAFLDLRPDGWIWPANPTHVPIILPRDYLVLYNFGFAPSQNLPQIGEDLILKIPVTIHLTGHDKSQDLPGKIVGFSDRLGSVLVPRAFLDWANAQFGEGQDHCAKLVIKARPDGAQALHAFLDQKKYQCNAEQLKTARLATFLRIALHSLLILGISIAALAFWVIALSLQLLITQNSRNLQRLIHLGYHPRQLLRRYAGLVGMALLSLHGLVLALIAGTVPALTRLGRLYGFHLTSNSISLTAGLLSIAAVGVFAIFTGMLHWHIYRLANPDRP